MQLNDLVPVFWCCLLLLLFNRFNSPSFVRSFASFYLSFVWLVTLLCIFARVICCCYFALSQYVLTRYLMYVFVLARVCVWLGKYYR